MDTYSSVEESLIKTRKPYTISKQRERWTEEEHNRFLEALKLYGRAWQRIEEHIGTKTAVQIRSHAQKFFTKLEKEGQSLDIDIPPPRPKRKPSNPYPRKTDLGTSYTQLVDLDKETSPEKPEGDERTGNGNDTQNENDCSEVLNLFQGASCTSLSSANRNCRSPTMAPGTSRTFREFVPIRKMVHDDGTSNTLNLEKAKVSMEKPIESEKTNENFQSENCGELSSNDMQTTQNYPKHAPVHVLKPFFSYTEAATVSANTQHVDGSRSSPFCPPTYPYFDPFHTNQDNYQAYLHASSVFSGLIVSSLLQNPAAHAAASFAASFWPCSNIKACADSVSSSLSPSSPSMAAIATATVSAATAWWTTHGLLPLCPPPLHNGFKINPDTPMRAGDELVSAVINIADKRENELSLQDQQQQLQPECSKLPSMSSSDSEKSEGANQNAGVTESANNEEADNTAATDPNNTKSVKQVDRSSCGSNTPSSSEVETDALKMHALEKAEEDLTEEQPNDINHPGCDFNNGRGSRSSSYITSESWKEVSEEGRLAFQALFSREVLPQSFWPPNDMRNKGNQTKNLETDQQKNKMEKIEDATELDLNSNMWGNCWPGNQLTTRNYTSLRSESNEKLLQLSMEIGQEKLKARGTGFKPYKRCSMEAKNFPIIGSEYLTIFQR